MLLRSNRENQHLKNTKIYYPGTNHKFLKKKEKKERKKDRWGDLA